MSGVRLPPRLAVALIGVAARRWPEELREQLHREWLGELHGIAGDPDPARLRKDIRAVRFGASLAVRRPARAVTAPLNPVGVPAGGGRPMTELFGATLGLVIVGTLVTMLLVSVPGFILSAIGDDNADPGNLNGLQGVPYLAVAPILVALGAVLGRRMARDRSLTRPGGVARAMLAIILAVLLAPQLFPIFGEGMLPPAAAVGLWALGVTPIAFAVARLARRSRGPLPWLAVAAGGLLVIDLAVTGAIWLAVGSADAPRASALAWFPTVLLDPVLSLRLGPGSTDESARFAILDFVELLPHALFVATAFSLWYVRAAVRLR